MPASNVLLCSREVVRELACWWNIREPAPLHHVSYPTLIDLIIRRNACVVVIQITSQFDNRNHLRRQFAIKHHLPGPYEKAAGEGLTCAANGHNVRSLQQISTRTRCGGFLKAGSRLIHGAGLPFRGIRIGKSRVSSKT